jgi:hypothetical protein
MGAIDKRLVKAKRQLRIKLGDIYESCSYHPVLCLGVDYKEDSIWGVSLVDGSYPCNCSLVNCGVRKLTLKQAWQIKTHGPLDAKDRNRISKEGRWWSDSPDMEAHLKLIRFIGPRATRVSNKPLKKRRARKNARAS